MQDYGFSGKCKLLHDCPGALEGIKNGTSPKICGFDGVTPVVCCTEVLLRKRMAVISEYSSEGSCVLLRLRSF